METKPTFEEEKKRKTWTRLPRTDLCFLLLSWLTLLFFLIPYFKAVMVVSVEEVSSSLVREYLSRKVGKAMANV